MTVADSEYDLKNPVEPLKPREPLFSPEVEVEREPSKVQRLASLDVFRGITILTMIIVNNQGERFYEPLEHARWDGWTLTDLVFPFFLFIVGVAVPFSFAKRKLTESRGEMLAHVWARALSLVLLGILLASWNPMKPSDPVPEGFTWLKILRASVLPLYIAGLLALLIPWPWRKVSLVAPLVVAALMLALGYLMHFALRKAFFNGLPESFKIGGGLLYPSQVRFPGVLQRIGVCYGVAATVALFGGWRTVLLTAVALFVGYAVLMLGANSQKLFPDHKTGSLTREDNLQRQVDELVFDRHKLDANGHRVTTVKHTYGEYPDPEGILSTLPAIGSSLLGILVGFGLFRPGRTNIEKCASLLAKGVGVTIIGVLLGWWLMPINKRLWTPSYTVFTVGLGMLTLGAVFYVMDVKGRRAWAWPFKVYGMNAIAAFVLSSVLVKVAYVIKMADGKPLLAYCHAQVRNGLDAAGKWWASAPYVRALPPIATPENQSLAWSLAFALVIFVILMIMYFCRLFVKV